MHVTTEITNLGHFYPTADNFSDMRTAIAFRMGLRRMGVDFWGPVVVHADGRVDLDLEKAQSADADDIDLSEMRCLERSTTVDRFFPQGSPALDRLLCPTEDEAQEFADALCARMFAKMPPINSPLCLSATPAQLEATYPGEALSRQETIRVWWEQTHLDFEVRPASEIVGASVHTSTTIVELKEGETPLDAALRYAEFHDGAPLAHTWTVRYSTEGSREAARDPFDEA